MSSFHPVDHRHLRRLASRRGAVARQVGAGGYRQDAKGAGRRDRNGGSGADIRLVVETAGNLTIGGIEGRLVQVFRNLIANALSFSPRGGTIRLKAFREGRAVVAEVLDEGPGIPEGREGEIFQRFYSLRPERGKVRRSFRPRSQHLQTDRRGTRWVDCGDEFGSRSNGDIAGACFTVRLPVTP